MKGEPLLALQPFKPRCRVRLGDVERAQRHATFASNHIHTLADDDYGNLVKGGLRRLQAALATGR